MRRGKVPRPWRWWRWRARPADSRSAHIRSLATSTSRKRHGAVVAQQQHPGLERARHAGGEEAGAGHEVEALAAIMRDGGAGRRRALAADHFRLAAPHVMDDDRHVAARTVEMRLDHLERERGCDRGIEGVAAFFQCRHADRGRDPMRRGDDAEGAFDFRTGRERVGIDDAHAGGKVTRRPRAATPRSSSRWGRPARISAPRRSCNSAGRSASGRR